MLLKIELKIKLDIMIKQEGIKEVTNILNDIFITFAVPLNKVMNVDAARDQIFW